MAPLYPNPWNFDNAGKAFVSPGNLYQVVYADLGEVGMGAPLGGACFLETPGNKKIKIHDWCGGPPAWETDGHLVAIPVWTRKFMKGTVQQMAVVNTTTMELTIYARIYRVLDLHGFDKKIIEGFDSPTYQTATVTFDIEKEDIESVTKLAG